MTMPEYEIVRSKRKTMALVIDRQGNLVVRAPLRMPEQKIRDFVWEKRAWIEKKQKAVQAAQEKNPPVKIEDGGRIPFLGEDFLIRKEPVEEVELHRSNNRLAQENQILLPADYGEQELRDWLKGQALDFLTARTCYYAKRMGLTSGTVKISNAKTLWGSCNGKNNIRFSWRLIFCPLSVLDYVVVHELSHIPYKNHGPKFWATVESVLPDYKERRAWLKKNNQLMEIL